MCNFQELKKKSINKKKIQPIQITTLNTLKRKKKIKTTANI